MPSITWASGFRELFDRCCEQYRSGNRDFESYYSETDLKFLKRIGYRTREFFDFVEDHVDSDGGEPSAETALLVASARRDFFQVVMEGATSDQTLRPADLPGRDVELGGYQWLPRILAKARAKLRGELDPDIMFGCSGDMAFLSQIDVHPADFLRAVWSAEDDDQKVIDFVKSRDRE